MLALALASLGCSEVAEVLTARRGGSGGETTATGGASAGGGEVGNGAAGAGSAGAPPANPELALSLSAGQAHNCVAKKGAVYCWGDNRSGQLGVGDREPHLGPVLAMGPGDVVEVSVGLAHSCWRDVSGNVSCFGDNSAGQLGVAAASSPVPAPVSLPAKATSIDVNYSHSCAVLETGELYCWGENSETQLGQGDAPDMNQSTPVRVGSFTNVARVACGQGHTVALLQGGELYSWGRNSSGEAGLGEGLPDRIRVPTLIPIDDAFQQLDAGQDSTCALDPAGKIYCWGDGEGLHLGNGSEATAWSPLALVAEQRFVQVATETFHSCAIDDQALLRCWGRGYEGQLGLGDNRASQATPELVAGGAWLAVSAGRFHTCAATLDQHVLCTGNNDLGELGQQDTMDRNVFVSVPLPD